MGNIYQMRMIDSTARKSNTKEVNKKTNKLDVENESIKANRPTCLERV